MWSRIRTAILLASLTALVLFVGQLVGGYSGLIIAGVIVVAMNFGSLYFSDKIVLKMYGAKPAPHSSHLYTSTKRLAKKAGLPMPKVYIIKSQQPNAFATGRSPKHAAVAANSGLIEMLTPEELDGVIAHELAHIRNYDTLLTTVAATFAGIISYVATMAQWAAIFGMGRNDNDNGNDIISLLVLIIVTPIVATMLQLALSRTREYLADKTGAEIAGSSEGLASALLKLDQTSKRIPMKGNQATGSMFIVNPFPRVNLAALFSTHPPIKERVRRLRSMA